MKEIVEPKSTNQKEIEIADQNEIRIALSSFLTEKEIKLLLVRGINRLRFKFKIMYNIDKGIAGVTLEDVIQETNYAFLTEKGRNWNKKLFPKFKDQYYSAFDSVLSNMLETNLKKEKNHYSILENDAFAVETNFEYKNELEQYEKDLKLLGASDDELVLFEPYYIQQWKRREIAEEFGITATEVTVIIKRLHRKVIVLQEKYKQ
jgi:RNA polymerase sigma factor (sigma-70 family)